MNIVMMIVMVHTC